MDRFQLPHRQANKPPKGARTNMGKTKKVAAMPPNVVDPQARRKGTGIPRTIPDSTDEEDDPIHLFSEAIPQRYSRLFTDDKWSQEDAEKEQELMRRNWRLFRNISSIGFHAVECDKVSNTQHPKLEQ